MKRLIAFAAALVAISTPTAAHAANGLPPCAPEQQALDGMRSDPTTPGTSARVQIYTGGGVADGGHTFDPDSFTVTVDGAPARSIPSWQENFSFLMPDTDAIVELTAQPVGLDPSPGAYGMVPVCTQTVTLVVHVKPLLTPSFVPTIERSFNSALDSIPHVRFALKNACQRV